MKSGKIFGYILINIRKFFLIDSNWILIYEIPFEKLIFSCWHQISCEIFHYKYRHESNSIGDNEALQSKHLFVPKMKLHFNDRFMVNSNQLGLPVYVARENFKLAHFIKSSKDHFKMELPNQKITSFHSVFPLQQRTHGYEALIHIHMHTN